MDCCTPELCVLICCVFWFTLSDPRYIVMIRKTLFIDWCVLFLLQPVGWSQKLFLAHGVVCGMDYLHSVQPHPVIHGDLRIDNILVGYNLTAKVSTLLTVHFIALIFMQKLVQIACVKSEWKIHREWHFPRFEVSSWVLSCENYHTMSNIIGIDRYSQFTTFLLAWRLYSSLSKDFPPWTFRQICTHFWSCVHI